LPAAAARIGVPAGTPMSMPGWQDSHARDSQNGEVIGPLTGQIRPPEPRLTGPAAAEAGPEKLASRAWIFADCACSFWVSSSSAWRRSRELRSSANLVERADWMRSRRFIHPSRWRHRTMTRKDTPRWKR